MKKSRAGRARSPATTDYAENIIKTLREPLVVLDSDLCVTNVNRSFCKTFGVTSSGTVGKFIYDLGNREWDIPELRTLLEDVLVQSHTIDDFSVEHDFERLGRRTMLLNARRRHNPKWKTKRILLAIEDVTERKQIEKRLQESEKWFSRFMQHLPGLAWIKDSDGRYVYANDAAESAFRTSRAALYGKSDREIFPPETAAQFTENDRQALDNRSSIQTIEELADAEGLVHHSIVNKFLIPGADDKAVLVGGIAIDITELKKAEEGLRESEERYRTLFDLGPVAVYSCDRSGVIQNFNRRSTELWGRVPAVGDTDERFCGSFKLFRPDGSFMPHEQCPMAQVVAGTIAEVRDAEVLIERPDGSRVTVVVNIRPLKNQQGEVTGAINCFYDISERKETERALRASEERYRTLFASIDEGSCIIEKVEGRAGEPLDFRYVEANPAFAAQSGVSGVVGKTIRQAFPGEPEEWFLTYDAIVRTGAPIRFERGLVSQGRVLELYAFRIEDGSHRRVAVIFKDITARKQAEEAQARLAAIVESSDDAIIGQDLNGVITSWNVGAERLFGYAAREAVGQPVTLHIPPDRVVEASAVLALIRRGEAVEHHETVRRRKDGTLVDVALTVSPILDSQGQVVGASRIARDITGRKKAAEALLEADRHKNEFLAMLAHELRNPLAPILSSIEILRRAKRLDAADGENQERTDRVDHALEVLQRQVGQMVRLVDDLLDAGRISRGKIDLRRERVEVAPIVHQAVEAARPLSEQRGQELTVVLPKVPVYVNADPTRLAQIVGNLLNNACKFTDRGGRIWLTVEPAEKSRSDGTEGAPNRLAPQIVIRVRDTGVGLAKDQLESIFDMFTQVDTSLERSSTGLGIGLTLVKALARLHGGTVEASSAGIGHGSEFLVRLPIMVAMDRPALQPATTAKAATPLRILVVDDNQDAAESLAMLLEFNGHVTHTAHNGFAAVEAAATLEPDVILLDIGLPGLNGYEVARQIRDQPREKGRPVLVALTGWGQEEDRRRSDGAGFDAHLVKPVDDVVLGKLLTELAAGTGKWSPKGSGALAANRGV